MCWSVRCSAAAAIALAAMTSTAHVPVSAEAVAVPSDFKLRLTAASLGPPRKPPDIQWVEIDASGEARLSEYHIAGKALPAATLKLSANAVGSVYQAVSKQQFFGLKPEYRDPNVQGGDQAVMAVTANGKTYTVRAVNIRVNALDAIARAVNAVLPANRAIRYNALHVSSYMAVER